MGVDFGDFNGDGHGDIFVTNFEMEDNSLYQFERDTLFKHVSAAAGLSGACRPLVGFGTGFADFDGDGSLDLFVINGHVYYHIGRSPTAQRPALFRNGGEGRFSDITERGGPYFRQPHIGRGAAVGDLDDDGAPDLVVVHQNQPVSLLKNRLAPRTWLSVQLRGTRCEPDAIGAVVTTSFAGRRVVRHIRSGAGYLSQFDRRVLLPLDEAEAGVVEVRWPGGRTEAFHNLAAARTHVLVEGQGGTP
jgi:hypothetical protein